MQTTLADHIPDAEFPTDDPTPRLERPIGGLDAFDPECELPDAERDDLEERPLFEFPHPWWHDRDVLESMYRERDLSLSQVANALGTNRESVRVQVNEYGLNEETPAQKLSQMNPEDLGLSPTTGERDEKYDRRRKVTA
ncbi:hypothetical protein [Halomontanus rarus]|uniref:hypothetical protein n=1 Tax=Halomontanus rarus TaxID=3034020 RepID=UPI0023E79C46|nr:hypothetical protein [Halovivax sp. TS33]